MSQFHYETGPITVQQIRALSDPDHGHGVAAPVEILVRMLGDHGGSTRVDSHMERRAAVLWRHGYGIFQGFRTCFDYTHGRENRTRVLIVPPKGMDAGAKDVILVDTRVPLDLLCPYLDISYHRYEKTSHRTEQDVYWTQIAFEQINPEQYKTVEEAIAPRHLTGMTFYDLLAAFVQRVDIPELVYLPGTVASGDTVFIGSCFRHSRGTVYLSLGQAKDAIAQRPCYVGYRVQ